MNKWAGTLCTLCGIQSSSSLWVLTGGTQVALFITVNVVVTFIAIFDGIIILIALATDWFDVSGFYLSFWGQCGQLFRLSQI